MKKVRKNGMVLAIVLSILMAILLGVGHISSGTSLAVGTEDYILCTIQSRIDGSVAFCVDFSANLKGLGTNVSDRELFKNSLKEKMNLLLNEEKAMIIQKFEEENIEKYDPELEIRVHEPVYSSESQTVGYALEFSSLEVFNYYYNLIDKSIEDKTFTIKVNQKVASPFARIDETSGKAMGDRYVETFLSASEGMDFENKLKLLYRPQFEFDYVTFNNRTHSNADVTLKDGNGFNHHFWVWEKEGIYSADISITLTVPVTGWWYLLGIGLPLTVMAVAIVVVVVMNKKKKIDKKETNS